MDVKYCESSFKRKLPQLFKVFKQLVFSSMFTLVEWREALNLYLSKVTQLAGVTESERTTMLN